MRPTVLATFSGRNYYGSALSSGSRSITEGRSCWRNHYPFSCVLAVVLAIVTALVTASGC